MSNYWKQSLVIGGIYWLISLGLYLWGNVWALTADAFLALALLIFLLPMKYLTPIKWLDRFMNKHPLISTWLASLGWVPYFTGAIFILTVIVVFAASLIVPERQDMILYWSMLIVGWIVSIRQLATLLIFIGMFIASLVYGKSIMGKLDDHYNVKKISESKEAAMAKAEVKDVKAKVKVVEKAIAKKASTKKKVAKKEPTKKVSKAPVKVAKAPTTKKSVVKAKAATKKTVAKAKPAVKAKMVKKTKSVSKK